MKAVRQSCSMRGDLKVAQWCRSVWVEFLSRVPFLMNMHCFDIGVIAISGKQFRNKMYSNHPLNTTKESKQEIQVFDLQRVPKADMFHMIKTATLSWQQSTR
ncbi:hypothetical protein E2542_SST24725 [Spatholobus suberectus]|nr:hypothetical protein E2542_SST24725 [Spatholobus suberectus]